jgi:hypothetical protein
MDLYDFINHAALGSPLFNTQFNQTGSSVWGWTDPISKREFIGMHGHPSQRMSGSNAPSGWALSGNLDD